MEKVDTVREQALVILSRIFEGKSYSNILIKNLGDRFSPLDRSFITELVYGTVKYKLRIDNIIKQLSKISMNKLSIPIVNILRMGIYQLDYMTRVPESAAVNESVKLAKKYGNIGAAKYVNGMMRNYIRNRDNISYPDKTGDSIGYLSTYYSFPEWLVKRLITEKGTEFTEEFLSASNAIPHLTVRVNRLKTDKDTLREKLADKGIEVYDGIYIDDALILKKVPGIENIEEYKEGLFTVQDESSMLAPIVLSPEPEEFIMDVCSAPGTKSTYIAELMDNTGTIISGDISESKLRLVEHNAERLGIDVIRTIHADASKVIDKYTGRADRVLVDAPCSGLGIMGKKPEIRWNMEPGSIEDIKGMQRSILDASCRYVKPGGILVYSTCTVLEGENIDMISGFARDNRNFVLEDISSLIPDKLKKGSTEQGYIELYPNTDDMDGFFIARLRRVE